MNCMKKIGFVLVAFFLASSAAIAQDVVSDTIAKTYGDYWVDADEGNSKVLNKSRFGDNWFFGVHVGTNYNWGSYQTHSSFWKKIRPTFALSLGKWFSPYVGGRLVGSYLSNRGVQENHENQKWGAISGNGDLLFSFTNLFNGYKESRPFNLVGVLGLGVERSFSFKDMKAARDARTKDWFLSGRVGLMGIFRLGESWDFTAEATSTWLDDGYDAVRTHNRYDGHINLMLGFVHRFRNHDGSHQFTYALRDWGKIDILNSEINRLRQKAADDRAYAAAHPNINVVNTQQINTLISFADDSAEIDQLQEVNVYTAAEAMKRLPKADLYITVLGKQTKNADLFMQRAQSIRDVLVNEYNIPAGRIYVEKNPALVESLDKTVDCVIMYINE